MEMKTSTMGVSLIKSFEGCRLKAYKCPAGVWSIGYGHTAGVKEGDSITQEQADDYLRNDLIIYEKAVNNYDSIYHFNQNQFDALVSFTYNCGTANLKSLTQSGKRTIKQISDKILLYNKAGGVVLSGIQRRRYAEREVFDTPVMTDAERILYYPHYRGDSPRVDEVLSDIGADSDYDMLQIKAYLRRKPIADVNGIKKYTGTAAQNNKIIKLAREGQLRRV